MCMYEYVSTQVTWLLYGRQRTDSGYQFSSSLCVGVGGGPRVEFRFLLSLGGRGLSSHLAALIVHAR